MLRTFVARRHQADRVKKPSPIMKNTENRSKSIHIACLTFLFATTACIVPLRSAGQQLTPQQGAARMEAARNEIAITRTNIVLTLEQLNLVRSSKDPKAQFQKFTEQLAKMEERARLTRDDAQLMKSKGDAYFADWEAQIAGIQDAERREQVKAGYSKRKKSYDRIIQFMQNAGKDFRPLLEMLKEIQALLEGERSQERVAAAKDLFMRANWRCGDVQRSLMEVEREFEFLAADLAGKSNTPSPAGDGDQTTNNTTKKDNK
jgi:hypothetical protein